MNDKNFMEELRKSVKNTEQHKQGFSDCWNNRERIHKLFRRKWCFRMEIEKDLKC